MQKTCKRCSRSKPVKEFYRNKLTKDGYAIYCKLCANDVNAQTTQRMRLRVLQALGDRCVGCGIDDQRVLTIDHIHGGGTQHRKRAKGAGYGYYKRMLENLSLYQLLCWNCQHLKRMEQGEHRQPVLNR